VTSARKVVAHLLEDDELFDFAMGRRHRKPERGFQPHERQEPVVYAKPEAGRGIAFGPGVPSRGHKFHTKEQFDELVAMFNAKPENYLVFRKSDNASTVVTGDTTDFYPNKNVAEDIMDWLGLKPNGSLVVIAETGNRVRRLVRTVLRLEMPDKAKDERQQAKKAQQAENERVRMLKQRGYSHAGKSRMELDPHEEQRFRADIQGPGIASPVQLGGAYNVDAIGRGGQDGVQLVEVTKGSPLGEAGFKAKDWVLRIGNIFIRDAKTLERALTGLNPGTPVEIYMKRGTHYGRKAVVPQATSAPTAEPT